MENILKKQLEEFDKKFRTNTDGSVHIRLETEFSVNLIRNYFIDSQTALITHIKEKITQEIIWGINEVKREPTKTLAEARMDRIVADLQTFLTTLK